MPIPGAQHEEAVAALGLRYPGLETRGFARRLIEEVGKSLCDFKLHADVEVGEFHADECLSCAIRRALRGRLPDAFLIAENSVKIFEVENTHPVSNEKLDCYTELAWVLDREYWDLPELIVVDRWGIELPPMDLIYDIWYRRQQQP